MTHTEERTSSSVTHYLYGDLDEVTAEMRRLLDKYHPLGYGTVVQYLGTSRHADARWECRIKRAASCE